MPAGGAIDLYNALNGSGAVQVNKAFGSTWRQPTEVQEPRILQFSSQIDF